MPDPQGLQSHVVPRYSDRTTRPATREQFLMFSQGHTDCRRAQASSHRTDGAILPRSDRYLHWVAILTSAGQVPGIADDGNVAGLVAGYQFQRYVRFHRQKASESFPDSLDTSHWTSGPGSKLKYASGS